MPWRKGFPATVQFLCRVGLGTGFTEAPQARARGGAFKMTGLWVLLRCWKCGHSGRNCARAGVRLEVQGQEVDCSSPTEP